MKRFFTVFMAITFCSLGFAQTPEGTWKLAPQAGALQVGPSLDNLTWWSNSEGDVTSRACLFDDTYVFNADGSFQNVQDGSTWLEGWQGVSEGCGTPIAPHDASNAATWTYDNGAATIKLTGKGAYLGIPKPYNLAELSDPADAPNDITYTVNTLTASNMTLDLNYGSDGNNWWRFKLVKVIENDTEAPTGFTVTEGKKTGTKVELLLDGSDNSGFVTYDITYDGTTVSTSAASGETASYLVTGLAESTQYTFSVIAKDESGNMAANNPQELITTTTENLFFPVTFEGPMAYMFNDFGSSTTSIEDNTQGAGKVMQFIKGDVDWSGTWIALDAEINFSVGAVFTVDIYSPRVGSTIKLKLENISSNSNSIELDQVTTKANEWETLEFNMANATPAGPGPYQVVTIFCGFDGSFNQGNTYLIDNIMQKTATAIGGSKVEKLGIYPNPVNDVLYIKGLDEDAIVEIYGATGNLAKKAQLSGGSVNLVDLPNGVYFVSVNGVTSKIIKK